ncbi:MAG: hypothetical protein ABSF09_13855 [Candidatus Bathyarchaeia archaeon]|jgi:hypothetical protein
MPSLFGIFWLALALAFSAMAWKTYKVRQVLVPKAIEEARGGIGAVMGIPAADLRKLKPIFDHTLKIEIIAFVLTAIAAILDFLVM